MKSWKIGIKLEICSEPSRKSVSGGKSFVLRMQNACRNKKNCIGLMHLDEFFLINKTEQTSIKCISIYPRLNGHDETKTNILEIPPPNDSDGGFSPWPLIYNPHIPMIILFRKSLVHG